MTPILCTLFDSHYLAKGLALIRSLRTHQKDFQLYVLALDGKAFETVRALQDSSVACLHLDDIVSSTVRDALRYRNLSERAWTLTPWWMQYLLSEPLFKKLIPHLAYMDADSFLFAPISKLYQEIKDAELAIIPHRFPARLAWRANHNGIYNVNFVFARNSERGHSCIRHWAAQCLTWCYQRTERANDGSLLFGDQGYLDNWETERGAHVVQHLGANLAPWNQEQFDYVFDGKLYVIKKRELERHGAVAVERIEPLLFFHFHGLNISGVSVDYGGYLNVLRGEIVEHVYQPYIAELRRIEQSLA